MSLAKDTFLFLTIFNSVLKFLDFLLLKSLSVKNLLNKIDQFCALLLMESKLVIQLAVLLGCKVTFKCIEVYFKV